MLVVVFVADIYRLYAGTSWTGLHVESEILSNSQEGRRRLYICSEWVCSVVFRCFQVLGIIDRAWLAWAGVRAAAGSWGTRAWWSLSQFVALVGFPLQTENHKTSSSKPLEVLGVSFLCFSHPKRNCLYRRSCKLANGRDTTRLRILHGKVYARKVLHRQCKQKRVKQPCHTGGPRYFGELHHAGLVWALRLGTIKANSRWQLIIHRSFFPASRSSPKRPGCCLFPRRVQKMFTSDCGCSQVVPRLLATRCRPGWHGGCWICGSFYQALQLHPFCHLLPFSTREGKSPSCSCQRGWLESSILQHPFARTGQTHVPMELRIRDRSWSKAAVFADWMQTCSRWHAGPNTSLQPQTKHHVLILSAATVNQGSHTMSPRKAHKWTAHFVRTRQYCIELQLYCSRMQHAECRNAMRALRKGRCTAQVSSAASRAVQCTIEIN